MVCMRWDNKQSLVTLLATLTTTRDMPHTLRVSLNNTHMADIRREFLTLLLGSLTFDVGTVLTLDEAWSDYDYCSDTFNPIVLLLSESGWVGGAAPWGSEVGEESPGLDLRHTSAYAASLSAFKYAKSDRRHSSRDFAYYKRVEARASRRNDRALLREAMSEVES